MADGTAQKKPGHKRFGGHRSPVSIGAIGILILLMMAVSAFYLNSLPLVGAGAQYTAKFTEAAGLRKGAEVRVAGVKVGEVSDVALDGNRVDVKFRVTNTWIGDQTQASIQIKTVLGQKYLSLEPKGDERLNPRDVIPIERTTAPYDVIDAFSDAARTTGDIDTGGRGPAGRPVTTRTVAADRTQIVLEVALTTLGSRSIRRDRTSGRGHSGVEGPGPIAGGLGIADTGGVGGGVPTRRCIGSAIAVRVVPGDSVVIGVVRRIGVATGARDHVFQ